MKFSIIFLAIFVLIASVATLASGQRFRGGYGGRRGGYNGYRGGYNGFRK